MNVDCYLLMARSPFHFGVRGVGIEAASVVGHADTLWSAFCLGLEEIAGPAELARFIAAYRSGEPPMLLSSAFPYAAARSSADEDDWQPPRTAQAADAVRFYPKPLADPAGLPDKPALRKALKGASYVSAAVFADWIAGRPMGAHLESDGLPITVESGQAWVSRAELKRLEGWIDDETEAIRLWVTGDVPRVTVDRVSSASQVFQAGRVTFQPGGGLWLGIRWGSGWQPVGESVLRALGDSGLGGERSAGHGQFTLLLLGAETWADPAPGAPFINLAFYWPPDATAAQATLGDPRARYTLEVRRGYMASHRVVQPEEGGRVVGAALRRRSVCMAGEGSLLIASGPGPFGGLANVTPKLFAQAGGHDVLRYGYAFPAAFGGATHD